MLQGNNVRNIELLRLVSFGPLRNLVAYINIRLQNDTVRIFRKCCHHLGAYKLNVPRKYKNNLGSFDRKQCKLAILLQGISTKNKILKVRSEIFQERLPLN